MLEQVFKGKENYISSKNLANFLRSTNLSLELIGINLYQNKSIQRRMEIDFIND
jgi:hypothetical protein